MPAMLLKALAAAVALLLGPLHAQAGACNRTCLEGQMSDYLTALAAHDPSPLPLAPFVLYTENDQVIPIGNGEWQVVSSLGNYRHVFSDPQSGQVAAITTITENGMGAIYIARLKIDSGGIREIETQITRDPNGATLYEKMEKPEDVWLEAVPVEKRISRDFLISQTNKYYSGMQNNNPNGNYSFFDKNCSRLEQAVQTTNLNRSTPYSHSNDTVFSSLGCEAQIQTGFLGFVTSIRDRMFPVVDEERQVVFAITTLDHNGTVRFLRDANGTTSPIPAYFDIPRTLQAMEGFRLNGDKLFRIEMNLIELPYGSISPFRPGPALDRSGAGNNQNTTIPCNGGCLDGVVVQVLHALEAHDYSSLPLAAGVRYSENGQFLALGDGLWETIGPIAMPGVDGYAARFSDPSSGTAAYWGLTMEHTTPGVLALRVKVDNGKINEIEAIDVRAESSGPRYGTTTLMRPPLPVEWPADRSLGKLDSSFQGNQTSFTDVRPRLSLLYFNGMELHSSLTIPFASGCLRRDNGFQGNLSCAAQIEGNGPAPNGLYNLTSTVHDVRILVTDSKRGVLMAVAMVDSTATSPGPMSATKRIPSTYMVPQLIKVTDGVITRVEGMVKWMPFGYNSAWSGEATFSR
ncbi:hypothetical protein L207DRAFT_574504 [Hyaloscypha variabilis F]|uniref:DUF8021 domain-containing protein n=1 Tax=Hyaloscypha variabilis (strain UAMH 11265 / GT02V1 / F) TaxID=1149755 RepID=A0A2J6QS59_HYAVF|nr:hypothetical protein L207DRAFT_574504 [Hyaloscypha variabilis F]